MSEHNVYRDGRVHVVSEKCATCIFRPRERPVSGARVAGMVRDTKDEAGATVVCHHTLYRAVDEHAICRGWWDRFAHMDPILRLAQDLGIVVEQPEPEPPSPCRRGCCWTPYGHSTVVNAFAPSHAKHCTCHPKEDRR